MTGLAPLAAVVSRWPPRALLAYGACRFARIDYKAKNVVRNAYWEAVRSERTSTESERIVLADSRREAGTPDLRTYRSFDSSTSDEIPSGDSCLPISHGKSRSINLLQGIHDILGSQFIPLDRSLGVGTIDDIIHR